MSDVGKRVRRRTSLVRRSAVAAGVLAGLIAAAIVLPGSAVAVSLSAHEVAGAHGSGARDTRVAPAADQTPGVDVGAADGAVDWDSLWAKGDRFAYIEATESTTYMNPYFSQQSNGAAGVGMLHGAYHFATPGTSTGAAQADYFVTHGGSWSADGMTLPPLLDIEYNPAGSECYGLSSAAMVNWISDFSNEVHAKTSRYPVIYTTADWWTTCTGNSTKFSGTNPLAIGQYGSAPTQLPGGWATYTFWQDVTGQEYFNGSLSALRAFAG